MEKANPPLPKVGKLSSDFLIQLKPAILYFLRWLEDLVLVGLLGNPDFEWRFVVLRRCELLGAFKEDGEVYFAKL